MCRKRKVESYIYNGDEKVAVENRSQKIGLIIRLIFDVIGILITVTQTIIMFLKKWIEGPLAIALVVMLVLNIIIFCVLFVYATQNLQKGSKYIKGFKQVFGFFKIISNIILLTMYGIALVSMYKSDINGNKTKMFLFALSMVVAILSLIMKVFFTLRKIMKAVEKKKYTVENATYIDGQKVEKKKRLFGKK